MSRFGFRPDSPFVLLDDAAHGGETDSRALEVRLAMQALKRREQLVGIAHVEADAIIAHKKCRLAVRDDLADLDHRIAPRPSVLDGIRDQIGKHLLYQPVVATDRR